MMHLRAFMVVLLVAGFALQAQAEPPTSLSAPLVPGETMVIAALYADQTMPMPLQGWPADQPFHYRLYLPDDYGETAPHRYPALFIASPLGNASMGPLAERLSRDRWIVIMLVESRNASNIWLPNFIAAYDDVLARLRIDPEMLFCTGVSGAAKVCSAYPGMRPGFRGMILQAAGFWRGNVFAAPENADLVVYGTFGLYDFNRRFAGQIRRGLPPFIRRKVEVWDGGHDWAPKPVLEDALDWVERKVLLEAPFDPKRADIYAWYVENQLAAHAAAETAVEKDALGEHISRLPAAWRTLMDSEGRRRLDEVKAAYGRGGHDPAVARERRARDAYRVAQSREETSRQPLLEDSIALYERIGATYADTVAGARAKGRAQALSWETGRPLKAKESDVRRGMR
ncbi:MAG: hypothetical protein ACTSWM_06075 [Alphaproteobacteria bacterium]